MKRVLLLTTGGTIASRQGENGLQPALGASDLLGAFSYDASRFSIVAESLFDMDSSNIQPEEWQIIARKIEAEYPNFDGFVITHGTDTLAYTASALSYMLQNLAKSVVLTGSQIPIGQDISDAQANLTAALWAVEADIWGVTVAFDRQIIRGTRAVKVSTMSFNAFQSVNARCLAKITAEGMQVTDDGHQLVSAGKPFSVASTLCNKVFLLKVIPGTQPDLIDSLSALGYKGLVIEAFGAGGVHYLHRNLLQSLKRLIDSGLLVVICSQCLYDRSDLTLYEVGRQLLRLGVVPALDMTTEAIVTKLMWVWGQTDDTQTAKELFCKNTAGEMS